MRRCPSLDKMTVEFAATFSLPNVRINGELGREAHHYYGTQHKQTLG